MALTDNLNVYFKLDESSGNAIDSVGSNDAVNTATTYSTGKINNGADFNGTTSILQAPSDTYLSATAFSVSFWLKTSYTSATALMAVASDDGTSNRLYQIGVTSSAIRFIRFDSGNNVVSNFTTTGVNVSDGAWHLVQAVFNGSSSVVYVDNVSRGSDAVSTNNNASSFGMSIGSNTYATVGEFLACSVDEVGVWSKALSSGERTALYNSGTGLQYPFHAVSALVVGGGGGGSHGGGGGGGYQSIPTITLLEQAYNIVVGAGGAGGINGAAGSAGSDSTFSTITGDGGGRGGVINNNGGNGGSGGGGGGIFSSTTTGGTATQGSAGGGSVSIASNDPAAGGGGSSAVGANVVNTTTAGAGGAGTANSISGSSVTYAGGGGGGGWTTATLTAGAGGAGGGGAGGINVAGTAGTANTGGGGGGAGNTSTAGAGGSGIVIISYPEDGSHGIGTDSTGGTITTSGGQRIHTFTSNGTFTASYSSAGSSNSNFFMFF